MLFATIHINLRTIRHLKFIQIFYRIKRLLSYSATRFNISWHKNDSKKNNKQFSILFLQPFILPTFQSESDYILLHGVVVELKGIDWSNTDNGSLWQYNRQYLDYLLLPTIDQNNIILILDSFLLYYHNRSIEPYPMSLIIINYAKLRALHSEFRHPKFETWLSNQIYQLEFQIEYHLLGNHVLENLISLYWGSMLLPDPSLTARIIPKLWVEIEAEICSDGGHYERSTMYHSLILMKLLDTLNLIRSNIELVDTDLEQDIETSCRKMLGWMTEMTSSTGYTPLFQDSNHDTMISLSDLQEYGRSLGVSVKSISLKDSGYRKMEISPFICLVEIATMQPTYQPGHSHAGLFSFVLYYNGAPIIVDPGASTYDHSDQRAIERGTCSHNTVCIDHQNQSEIWHVFRVARRSRPEILIDQTTRFKGRHSGYHKKWGSHIRDIHVSDGRITINDTVGMSLYQSAFLHLHFHPDCVLQVKNNQITINQIVVIKFEGVQTVQKSDYDYCQGFNHTTLGSQVIVQFTQQMTTKIFTVIKRA